MQSFKFIGGFLLVWIFMGPVHADSGPDTIRVEQDKRRREGQMARVAREQSRSHYQFERKLSRFDRKASGRHDKIRRNERRRLQHRLQHIQQQEKRSLSHLEQTLRHLEVGDRHHDSRQKQELKRLQHRHRGDAFLYRQKVRLRESRLNTPGWK